MGDMSQGVNIKHGYKPRKSHGIFEVETNFFLTFLLRTEKEGNALDLIVAVVKSQYLSYFSGAEVTNYKRLYPSPPFNFRNDK